MQDQVNDEGHKKRWALKSENEFRFDVHTRDNVTIRLLNGQVSHLTGPFAGVGTLVLALAVVFLVIRDTLAYLAPMLAGL